MGTVSDPVAETKQARDFLRDTMRPNMMIAAILNYHPLGEVHSILSKRSENFDHVKGIGMSALIRKDEVFRMATEVAEAVKLNPRLWEAIDRRKWLLQLLNLDAGALSELSHLTASDLQAMALSETNTVLFDKLRILTALMGR